MRMQAKRPALALAVKSVALIAERAQRLHRRFGGVCRRFGLALRFTSVIAQTFHARFSINKRLKKQPNQGLWRGYSMLL